MAFLVVCMCLMCAYALVYMCACVCVCVHVRLCMCVYVCVCEWCVCTSHLSRACMPILRSLVVVGNTTSICNYTRHVDNVKTRGFA